MSYGSHNCIICCLRPAYIGSSMKSNLKNLNWAKHKLSLWNGLLCKIKAHNVMHITHYWLRMAYAVWTHLYSLQYMEYMAHHLIFHVWEPESIILSCKENERPKEHRKDGKFAIHCHTLPSIGITEVATLVMYGNTILLYVESNLQPIVLCYQLHWHISAQLQYQ